MATEDRQGDFELIRDTLLKMDPETRHQVIEAMKAIRACPPPVAVRVLADAAMRSRMARPRLVWPG